MVATDGSTGQIAQFAAKLARSPLRLTIFTVGGTITSAEQDGLQRRWKCRRGASASNNILAAGKRGCASRYREQAAKRMG
jgi:hypothetical protein